jgi:hypothetical protein
MQILSALGVALTVIAAAYTTFFRDAWGVRVFISSYIIRCYASNTREKLARFGLRIPRLSVLESGLACELELEVWMTALPPSTASGL